MQTRRRGVHDQIEPAPGQIGEAATGYPSQVAEAQGQFHGLSRRAVGDHQLCRPFGQQRLQHPTGRAARPQQQNLLVRQRTTMIAGQIAHQTRSIGIVAAHSSGIEDQGIHRPGPFGARTEQVGEHPGILFERHGHVQPLAAGIPERSRRRREAVRFHQHGAVFEMLAGLGGKQRMNPWGLAVGDGVAHHGIVVR